MLAGWQQQVLAQSPPGPRRAMLRGRDRNIPPRGGPRLRPRRRSTTDAYIFSPKRRTNLAQDSLFNEAVGATSSASRRKWQLAFGMWRGPPGLQGRQSRGSFQKGPATLSGHPLGQSLVDRLENGTRDGGTRD